MNQLAPSYLQDLFQVPSSDYNLRSVTDDNLKPPKPNLEIFKKSLQYSGSLIWNEIPHNVKKSESVKTFKEKCFSFMFNA